LEEPIVVEQVAWMPLGCSEESVGLAHLGRMLATLVKPYPMLRHRYSGDEQLLPEVDRQIQGKPSN
jgi:hypothetical protein